MVQKGKQTLLSEAEMSDIRRQASAMEVLKETEGWKILVDWANRQIEDAKEKLSSPIRTREFKEVTDTGEITTVITKEEVIAEINGQIDGVRMLLRAVEDTINAPSRIAEGVRNGTILIDHPEKDKEVNDNGSN